MVVYIVTTSPYGERKIQGVFEDRDQAIYCCALLEHDDAELEEWETDTMQFSGKKKPLVEWTVYVNAAGEAVDTCTRYTFEENSHFSEDVGGSWVVFLTQPMEVSEDEVKEIVLDTIQRRKEKSRNHKIT